MRSIFLLFLVFGASNAFLTPLNQLLGGIGDKIQTVHNSITQTATNLWNGVTGQVNNVIGNVVDSAGNVYGQLVSTANGVKFSANFLWDNVFGPAYDLFIEGGQLFLDDKFGNIVSSIGRRSVLPEVALAEKFSELSTTFKSNLRQFYQEIFSLESQAILAFHNGGSVLQERLQSFSAQLNAMETQINQWLAESKQQLQDFAQTLPGDWSSVLNQYTRSFDAAANAMLSLLNTLGHDLIAQLTRMAGEIVPSVLGTIKQNLFMLPPQ